MSGIQVYVYVKQKFIQQGYGICPEKNETVRNRTSRRIFRKGDDPQPYITHPAAVVRRLLSWGIPEDSPLIDAAWGHDLIEDAKVPKDEIIAVSSQEFREIIDQQTFDPEKCSKEEYIEKAANSGSRSVLLDKAADRPCSTEDFIETFSRECVRTYLHCADSIRTALQKLPQEPVFEKCLKNGTSSWLTWTLTSEIKQQIKKPLRK